MTAARPDPVAALHRCITDAGKTSDTLVIAYSGGFDSSVLLHAAVRAVGAQCLVAAHVDHGLQSLSPAWAKHCADTAAQLGVHFELRRADITSRAANENVEAWARSQRYALLVDVMRDCDAAVLLTAHHADDQIETFLMRLARGTGLDGLACIRPQVSLGPGLDLLRPFLALDRVRLRAWARRNGLRQWIEDPSNADVSRTRNAVRHQLVPVLDRVLPGLRRHLPSTIALLASEGARLRRSDDERLAVFGGFPGRSQGLSVQRLRALPDAARRTALLRAWLRRQGLRAPSQRRMGEWLRQLGNAAEPDRIALHHDGHRLVCRRGLLVVADATKRTTAGAGKNVEAGKNAQPSGDAQALVEPIRLQWTGQTRIVVPGLGGRLGLRLELRPGRPGLAACWLRGSDLSLAPRRGGERLRERHDRPSRTLKNLYQERGLPAWRRRGLPVLWAGGRPVWAAGIGVDAGCVAFEGERYRLGWLRGVGARDPGDAL